jgi:uncharacterized membrane protein YeaQ/YmgE (transglycosylase-associated protein family)
MIKPMEIQSILANPVVVQVLTWLGLGLAIGLLAKMLVPGNENMGWVRTIMLGLIGSVAGNFVATYFLDFPIHSAMSWQGILIGVAASVILVLINRLVTKS